MPTFRSIEAPVRTEIDRIKASRFIADAAPVTSTESARSFVEDVVAVFPDASHHCFAWRIDEHETRSSDAGEPSGSAGRPILNRIVGQELSEVVIVVTRYFGGTKLGTGGLVRAYGAAAQAAIDVASIVVREATTRIEVAYAYDLSGAVQSVLTQFGLEPAAADYAVDVRVELIVPVDRAAALIDELSERTAGQVCARVLDD